ncbi:transposase, partial [Pseudobacteriovorax antillogorgiicola]|uniref:transposase n=1 Tax=Pseudobacteriovorax antillogorgiicola TaxID=1513793 RepID=UPI00117AEE94
RKKPTQDGRSLRRYRKRWVVERFFSWLFSYRRTKVRYEVKIDNFLGMVYLATMCIGFRHI